MRCKFDSSSPCGMKDYLGICACDMCKENPTRVYEHSKKKEFEVNLKNIDLTEFYNFDIEPVAKEVKPVVLQVIKEEKEEKVVVDLVKVGLFSKFKNWLFRRYHV